MQTPRVAGEGLGLMFVEALDLEGPRPRGGRDRHHLCAAAASPLSVGLLLRFLELRLALTACNGFGSSWILWSVSAVARLVVALAGEL